jgi:hypothetical protein
MTRECPVRFCEQLGVKFPRLTHREVEIESENLFSELRNSIITKSCHEERHSPTLTDVSGDPPAFVANGVCIG